MGPAHDHDSSDAYNVSNNSSHPPMYNNRAALRLQFLPRPVSMDPGVGEDRGLAIVYKPASLACSAFWKHAGPFVLTLERYMAVERTPHALGPPTRGIATIFLERFYEPAGRSLAAKATPGLRTWARGAKSILLSVRVSRSAR